MKNEIYIYGYIGDGWGSVSAAGIAEALKAANGEPVTLRINSGGGAIWEGVAIYNQLKGYAGKVTAIVDGVAGSIASVIALGASEIRMGVGALFFIHSPLAGMDWANADELRKAADDLDKHEDGIVDIYARRTGKSAEEIRAMMKAETYLTAEESVAHKFADSIVEVDAARISNRMSFLNSVSNALPVAAACKAAGVEFSADSIAALIAKASKADESDKLLADMAAKAQAEVDEAKAAVAAKQSELAAAQADCAEKVKAAEDKLAADLKASDEKASLRAQEILASGGFKGKLPAASVAPQNNLTGLARAVAAHRAAS